MQLVTILNAIITNVMLYAIMLSVVAKFSIIYFIGGVFIEALAKKNFRNFQRFKKIPENSERISGEK